MQANTVINVAGMIVVTSMIFVVVSNPGSAGVLRALGEAFSASIRAATGR